jgi:hypothetical protein
MTLFRPLEQEVALWRAAGREATVWWRDDDAVAPTAAFDRLLALARGVPIAIAAVPVGVSVELAARLATDVSVGIIQHGFAHLNHRPVGEKSAEFAADRPLADMLAELATGWRTVATVFGTRARPILVPPWNRIAPDLAAALRGYSGLSTFGRRRQRHIGRALVLNAHVDPIRWREDRTFIGGDAVVARLVEHLAARRTGACDPEEVTGLLTHHLAHDEALWAFLEEALPRLKRMIGLRFLTLDELTQ